MVIYNKNLIQKINVLAEHVPLYILQQASAEISERYRLQIKPYLTAKHHYLAYLITRFPATFAVTTQVLKNIQSIEINSMLDLGAGPGTGFLALSQYFPHLSQATLLETEAEFIALGQ